MTSATPPDPAEAADQVDDEAPAPVPDAADHDAEVAAMRAAERIANDYRPYLAEG